MADISKEIQDFKDAVYGEEVRGSMISLAEKVNTESTNAKTAAAQSATSASESAARANTAVGAANTAISTANTSAERCNIAASNANAKALLANNAAQTATTVAKTVQEKLDSGDFVGPQGVKGEKGDPFQIAKVYESVAEMNAGYATDEVKVGQFVIINTGSVEDEDNAKLYLKGTVAYEYITDLSGAQGMQGPQGIQGMQGVRGEKGETGEQGPPGSVDNLEQQILAYTEPADPAEGETETVPESGSTLSGIVGWLMKKVKSMVTSIANLSRSYETLNQNLYEVKLLLPPTTVEQGGTYTLTESYKNFHKVRVHLSISSNSVATVQLSSGEEIPTSIISTAQNFIGKYLGVSPAIYANIQCGFPADTTFGIMYLVRSEYANNNNYNVHATVYGLQRKQV